MLFFSGKENYCLLVCFYRTSLNCGMWMVPKTVTFSKNHVICAWWTKFNILALPWFFERYSQQYSFPDSQAVYTLYIIIYYTIDSASEYEFIKLSWISTERTMMMKWFFSSLYANRRKSGFNQENVEHTQKMIRN